MISEHVETFADLPVRDYDPSGGINDPMGTAQRLSIDYDAAEGGATFDSLLGRFLDDPAARDVKALVVGAWGSEMYEGGGGGGSAPIVAALAGAAARLPKLRALFLGDIISEECEISWINQSDVAPLLEAYPDLEHFRVRGGTGLAFSSKGHPALRTLEIEAGGLPAEVVRSVAAADLPRLERLELWLGTDDYGGDSSPDDLAPILSGAAFPALSHLGLRNCDYADALAAALAEASILRRLETLDLSLGTLGDEGALALIRGGSIGTLKRLDIHHHYVTDEVLDGLMASGVGLNADDRQEAEAYDGESHRYVAVGE